MGTVGTGAGMTGTGAMAGASGAFGTVGGKPGALGLEAVGVGVEGTIGTMGDNTWGGATMMGASTGATALGSRMGVGAALGIV